MKKTRFLWILIDEKHRISPDRLFRFQKGKREMTIQRVVSNATFFVDNALIHGDYVCFKQGIAKYLGILGQIINFQFDESLKSKRAFPYSYCILDLNKKVKIFLSPCYFVTHSGQLEPLTYTTFHVNRYVCSINIQKLDIPCRLISSNDLRSLKRLFANKI